MRSFLQFGVVCYLVAIGLEAFLAKRLIQRGCRDSFTTYSCFIVVQSIVMFTLLSNGNSGLYRTMYWVSQYIQDGLVAWVAVDILWRFRSMTRWDKHILAGLVIAVVFPAILQYRDWAPTYMMYFPTFAFMGAQTIWLKGLRDAAVN